MKRFNKITIIGVGLIGGSIGLAARKRRLAREVVGVFRRRSTLRKALARGVVDRAVMDMAEGVRGADLVIICSPVHSIPALAIKAARYAKAGAVITDVGSTKAWIVADIEKALKGSTVRFVGSHPMAGSEKTGPENARGDLLEGSPCIVTRTPGTDRHSLDVVASFWRSLGAKVSVLTAAQHDRAISLVSHLPHVVAFSLAGAVPREALGYAAEGFKDTTRVASSDAALWSDIFLTNRAEVIRAARLFRRHFDGLVAAISAGDRRKTAGILNSARLKRDKLICGSHANRKR